ncbi:MAG: translation initiation factor [Bacteroidales bacterium]|nr:translation initiation factor [Bacteroidales bacterium]
MNITKINANMAQKDWREILNASLGDISESNPVEFIKEDSKKVSVTKQNLIIRFEKRNGKPATIISNFQGSESELKDLAATLKKHCGVGGSAKDDEILIQGDVRNKVSEFLRRQGHSVCGMTS